MNRLRNLAVIAAALYIICSGGVAQTRTGTGNGSVPGSRQEPSKVPVDYKGDDFYPVLIGDSSVYVIVGNVAFHHNGAIIVCDSAVRYNEYLSECFNNVIIQKDSTFIYGDRIYYDGMTNTATVFAPIVKMIDGDATMYSRDLAFNTLSSVATYTQGGTITQKDNLMESVRAEYHTDTRTIYFADSVTVKNDRYLLTTDSLSYDFDTEISYFYRNTLIWNEEGDFLSADRGSYIRPEDKYIFTDNSYILTEKQQLWGDSITYLRAENISYMFNDIQIFEEEQNLLAFGDHGIYWGEQGDAILTRNPSIIGMEEKASGEIDSVYMRGDSILLYTIDLTKLNAPVDSLSAEGVDGSIMDTPSDFYDQLGQSLEGSSADSVFMPDGIYDELEGVDDTLSTEDEIVTDEPEEVEMDYDGKTLDVAEEPGEEEEEAVVAEEKSRRQQKRELRAIRRLIRMRVPGYDPSMITRGDKAYLRDSAGVLVDSLVYGEDTVEELDQDGEIEEIEDDEGYKTLTPQDSIQRIVKAYYNVKIFRSDFQAVCDSIIGFTKDSTAHMYRSLLTEEGVQPVLWNEANQIFSDQIHIFSRNQELEHAEFEGVPMMIEQVSDTMYNQITGRKMYAYFKNNDIERLDVKGNGETYYYMMESGETEPGGFFTANSVDIFFEFDTIGIYKLSYTTDVLYTLYPMDQIPESQPVIMKSFKWYGDERPQSKEDVFDRVVRASRREETEMLEKPVFEITGRIDAQKAQYTEEGIWRERDEEPQITPEFFEQRYGRGR